MSSDNCACHSGNSTCQIARSSLLWRNPRLLNHASMQNRLWVFFSGNFSSHSSPSAAPSSDDSASEDDFDRTGGRYFEILEDVVNQIYSRMDLLLFTDEDEAPLNSEDSRYKSCRDEVGEEDVSRYLGGDGSNSAEERFCQDEDHLPRLSDARDRRERARRFKSFTSWMPDLLRAWAPRVLTSGKNRIDFSRKKGRTRETCDMVLETQFTENKRFCHRMRSPRNQQGLTSQPGVSVSKALFPEDP